MGKKGGGDGGAAQARADEQARQEKIRAGTVRVDDIFKQNFTDDFYNNRQSSYLDYATPQVDDQYNDAKKQLTYSLARAGTLDSSVRADKEAELGKEYTKQRQGIADQALSYKTQAMSNVEDARSGLISTLNANGDADGAANNAIARSSALSQPTAFSPIGQLFGTFTNALGAQAAMEKAQAYSGGVVKAPYNTGLFATPGAVKVSG